MSVIHVGHVAIQPESVAEQACKTGSRRLVIAVAAAAQVRSLQRRAHS